MAGYYPINNTTSYYNTEEDTINAYIDFENYDNNNKIKEEKGDETVRRIATNSLINMFKDINMNIIDDSFEHEDSKEKNIEKSNEKNSDQNKNEVQYLKFQYNNNCIVEIIEIDQNIYLINPSNMAFDIKNLSVLLKNICIKYKNEINHEIIFLWICNFLLHVSKSGFFVYKNKNECELWIRILKDFYVNFDVNMKIYCDKEDFLLINYIEKQDDKIKIIDKLIDKYLTKSLNIYSNSNINNKMILDILTDLKNLIDESLSDIESAFEQIKKYWVHTLIV